MQLLLLRSNEMLKFQVHYFLTISTEQNKQPSSKQNTDICTNNEPDVSSPRQLLTIVTYTSRLAVFN